MSCSELREDAIFHAFAILIAKHLPGELQRILEAIGPGLRVSYQPGHFVLERV